MAFRQNAFNGSSGLSVSHASCSSVEMVDVVFANNTCGDQCFAKLAQENDLRDLRLRRNKRLSEESTASSLMTSPKGSSTSVSNLIAGLNELSVMRIVEGSLEMRNAEIETTSESTLLLDHAQGVVIANSSFRKNSARLFGAAILSNTTESLSISNCSFTSNIAETGGAIASFYSNLSIDGSFFRDNVATVDAGSLLVSNGTLELLSSIFQNNTALVNGGAIFLTTSISSRLSAVQCHNNTARNGGCLKTSASRDLVVRKSVLSNNSADNGGGIYYEEVSESKIVNTVFEENVARSAGGGVFLVASPQMELHNCTLKNNTATTGGGFDCWASERLVVRRCTLSDNRVSYCNAQKRSFV